MIPLTSTIKGFGPHVDTTVNWEDSGALAALVAPNGSGKTFLLETPFACLYGEFPSRPGSLADNLTLNGTGEGVIETRFAHGGQIYSAVREVKRTGQKCWLEAGTDGGSHEVIAGPKVRDFEAAVDARFGDAKTALATWFSAQGGQGDLTTAVRQERRVVFGKLLGFEVLDAESDRMRDMALQAEAQASTLSGQLVGLPDFDQEIGNRKAQCDALVYQIEEITGKRDSLVYQIEETRGKIRDSQGGEDILKGQIAAHTEALNSERSREAEVRDLSNEVRELEGRAARRLEAERADAEVKDLELQLGPLDEQARAFFRRRDWEVDERQAREGVEAVKKTISALEAVPGCDEATKAKALKLEAIGTEYREARAENAQRKEANGRLQVRRVDLQGRIAALEAKISQAESRLAEKPETPFGEKCSPCQFLREFAKLPEDLAKWRAELAKDKEQLAAIPADAEMKDLEEIARRGEEAKAAKASVDASAGTATRLQALREDLAERESTLRDLRSREVPVTDDPAPRRREIEQQLAQRRPVANRLALCQDAEQRLSGRRSALEKAEEQLVAAKRRVAETQGPADSAKKALAAREEQLRALRNEEAETQATLKSLTDRRDEVVRQRATLEAEIRSLTERKAESEQKRQLARVISEKAQGLRTLQTVFGKKGIQPILIDQAAPQLEGIAAAMTEAVTDGKVCLRISTQRALKDGRIDEDILFLACDSQGERDITRYSGGEKRILQTILRLSIMLWIGRLRGRPAECIFVDEAFDALDSENDEKMVSLLTDLSRQFGRVVVITHKERVAAMLPRRIEIKKTAAGVTVLAA